MWGADVSTTLGYMRDSSRNTASSTSGSRTSGLRALDPSYSFLTVAAGTLMLAGTTSTVAVSTLELARAL